MFVAFVFILVLYYLEQTVKLDQKKYDVNTITASDFTVEFDITDNMWKYFLATYYEGNGENEEEESGQKYS
jgi:hypothetical protein